MNLGNREEEEAKWRWWYMCLKYLLNDVVIKESWHLQENPFAKLHSRSFLSFRLPRTPLCKTSKWNCVYWCDLQKWFWQWEVVKDGHITACAPMWVNFLQFSTWSVRSQFYQLPTTPGSQNLSCNLIWYLTSYFTQFSEMLMSCFSMKDSISQLSTLSLHQYSKQFTMWCFSIAQV
jgi:hypothetical protein